MQIINMTPHSIVFIDKNDIPIHIFPPNKTPVHLKAETVPCGYLGSTPTGTLFSLTRTDYMEPEGLPGPTYATFYIVSRRVKCAFPYRSDLLVPAEVVRNASGKIIGCKSFGI